jgi:Zn-dependent metalloprotease
MCRWCSFIPEAAYRALSRDPEVEPALRAQLRRGSRVDAQVVKLREANRIMAAAGPRLAPQATPFPVPRFPVFDARHGNVLPGQPVADPMQSADAVVVGAVSLAEHVARFFAADFDRNSFDHGGGAMQSTVHFLMKPGQAKWSGSQVLFSDGDGSLFLDPTLSDDLVAHEWGHAVVGTTVQLSNLNNEAGALNESLADVFGAMFRQWRAGQGFEAADWKMGMDLIGPGLRARGITCIRDMADPGAPHCILPQPVTYSGIQWPAKPHLASGVPNRAFYLACRQVGGNSWQTIGQVWYRAIIASGRVPGMTLSDFASRTRNGAQTSFGAATAAAVDQAWLEVGL